MGFLPDVLPNTVITSQWGNAIRDQVISTVDTVSNFAEITDPQEGQYVHVLNPGALYLRANGTWRVVMRKDGSAWRWVDGAWGRLNGTTATVANPAGDWVVVLSDYNPVTINAAGFGPFQVTSPGGRIVQLNGIIRLDGGGLTSTSASVELYLQRVGAASDLSLAITAVSQYGSQSGPSTVVASLFAIDQPPAGTSTYQLVVRWRAGNGNVKVGVPLALIAADLGPTSFAATAGASAQIQGL